MSTHGDDRDHTRPLQVDHTAPVAPVSSVAPTGSAPAGSAPAADAALNTAAPMPRAPRRERRRFGDIAVASLLAATLASGGTYAAVRAADDGATAPSTSASAGSAGPSGGSAQGTTVSLTGEQDWGSVAAAVSPSVVSIEVAGAQGQGAGSGVVWDDQGHIVTNAHVVEGAQKVHVTLSDGRSYPATVVGTDPSSDLAVIKLSTVPSGVKALAVGDDQALEVGDPVMAIGNPLGLSGTVTTGIVSALDRPVTTQATSSQTGQASLVVTNAIQTSAAINPGNSGGALVNAAGQLVGINSSIASLSQGGGQAGSIGIGFAIPSGKVKLIADQLIATGHAQHAFLGVGLDNGQAEVDGATLTGAQVKQVEAGSPAEGAGLRTGDLIVGMDGEPVTSPEALMGQVRERASGAKVRVTYVREGKQAEAAVILATRPDEG